MKKPYLAHIAFFLLIGIGTPVFGMWGEANDEDDGSERQAVIQRQLKDLEPLEVQLEENNLIVTLKEDNKAALGKLIPESRELLEDYDVHLNYEASLDEGELYLLRNLKKLVFLSLDQTLDHTTGEVLSEILKEHGATLKGLRFSGGNNLTDDGLIAIQQSMNALPELKTLSLMCQPLTSKGALILSNILSNLYSLEYLSMNELPDVEADLSPLSELIHLNTLKMSNNKFKGDFLRYLTPFRHLVDLDISNNNITAEMSVSLSRSNFNESLKILNISNNNIGDVGATYISMLPNLEYLDILHNRITDNGAGHIWLLRNLTYLNISHNEITDNGVNNLANLNNLTYLNLSDNIGASLPAFVAGNLTNLTDLNLSNNKIGDDGARALGRLISLTKLNLQNNNITLEGTKRIARLPNLIELNLSQNPINKSVWDSSTSLAFTVVRYASFPFLRELLVSRVSSQVADTQTTWMGEKCLLQEGVEKCFSNIYPQDADSLKIARELSFATCKYSLKWKDWELCHNTNCEYGSIRSFGIKNLLSMFGINFFNTEDPLDEATKLADCNLYVQKLQNISINFDSLSEEFKKAIELIQIQKTERLTEFENAVTAAINSNLYVGIGSNMLFLLGEHLLNSSWQDLGARVFANHLTLKDLKLERTGTGNVGAKALAKNTTLEKLDLTNNDINSNGARHFCNNTSLKTLKLKNNKVSSWNINEEKLHKKNKSVKLEIDDANQKSFLQKLESIVDKNMAYRVATLIAVEALFEYANPGYGYPAITQILLYFIVGQLMGWFL